ncbi:LysR family transcriptional regulator [Marinomonas spartinae]|uniref:LysR family transcriptional regulator n=1 Tax=Marinomonas spartinae TaxID=1792290 RepID=UPI0018F17B33|nr:LysR family transcriptional regulator [Marinomonas spartinae]MBJ7556597.1 LysR family transcriptional regulator [Marinomonas spartinae]
MNLLVALDVLIRRQSVSLAAEELHLSQSAMSNSLSRLRDYFQDDLLTQVGRKMVLTHHAQQLEQPVRDILVLIEASLMLVPGFDPTTSVREFKICVSDYTLYTLVPYVLEVANEQKSSVKLNFLPQVGDPKKELDRSEADLLIIPSIFCSDDHPSEPLHEDEFRCVVWSHSHLALGDMTIEKFLSAGHICMQPPNSNPSFETYSFEKAGIHRNIQIRAFSFSCLPSLLIGTDRIATLQNTLVKKAISQGLALTSMAPPVELPRLQEHMQWHKYQNADLGMIWLREVFKEAVKRLLSD